MTAASCEEACDTILSYIVLAICGGRLTSSNNADPYCGVSSGSGSGSDPGLDSTAVVVAAAATIVLAQRSIAGSIGSSSTSSSKKPADGGAVTVALYIEARP
jgi:hypothetical protein